MGQTFVSVSVSLDGYVAGPYDRPGQGLGEGGEVLHRWFFEPDAVDAEVLAETTANLGAHIVGRRTFDLARAWGGELPFGIPCLVLTHLPPEQWTGPDSPFTFVTDGLESAVQEARKIAGDKRVIIGGGAEVIRETVRAGIADALDIHLVPVLLGRGIRIFQGAGTPGPRGDLELVSNRSSANAVHLSYRMLSSEQTSHI